MSQENVNVNPEDEFDTIYLDEDDECRKFIIVPIAFLHDNSMSLDCRGFIGFLFSCTPERKILKHQILTYAEGYVSKNKCLKWLNEAIAAGWVTLKENSETYVFHSQKKEVN